MGRQPGHEIMLGDYGLSPGQANGDTPRSFRQRPHERQGSGGVGLVGALQDPDAGQRPLGPAMVAARALGQQHDPAVDDLVGVDLAGSADQASGQGTECRRHELLLLGLLSDSQGRAGGDPPQVQ